MFVPSSPIVFNNRSRRVGLWFVCFCSASQAERIDMLNIALNEKGIRVASGGHTEPTKTAAVVSASQQPPARPPDAVVDESNGAIDGGVML